jgi:hypothetical protein
MDVSGNTQEITKYWIESLVTFETTLTKAIDIYGITTNPNYDENKIVLVSVVGNAYTWQFLP